jgi:hypothetical protein
MKKVNITLLIVSIIINMIVIIVGFYESILCGLGWLTVLINSSILLISESIKD